MREEEPKQEAKKPTSRRKWIILGVILIVPVLYFLSFGPAYKYYQSDCPRSVTKAIESVYAPMWWLRNNTTSAMQRLVDGYLELWLGDLALPDPG